ncbi:hypothetical protein NPIL_664511 [Nephila pilipes]|uniref:Uncharacterized protein n=1 Tax=Nephila pilipes TaxID=299642 RepID=A0A8X6QEA2_NEPPI|nr:hypothetical protein NPIL_664511 [Nephila pilipes]
MQGLSLILSMDHGSEETCSFFRARSSVRNCTSTTAPKIECHRSVLTKEWETEDIGKTCIWNMKTKKYFVHIFCLGNISDQHGRNFSRAVILQRDLKHDTSIR